MLEKLKQLIFGMPPLEKNHEFFGKILFMGGKEPELNDYWENEQKIEGIKEPISILITADIDGPSYEQVQFYKDCINDLDQLFSKCWRNFSLSTGKK